MTNQVSVLSESEVEAIEARYELASGAFHPYAEVAQSLEDIPALCATVKALRRSLESIRDCTPDMWSCSMAEQILNGASFEDALAASKKYDTDGGMQSQLAALREENERLNEALDTATTQVHKLAGTKL